MQTSSQQIQRKESLARLLLWEGRLNNARLRELFGISQIRASEWLREFVGDHPEDVTWNSKTRSHHATPAFYRRHERAKPAEFAAGDSLSAYLSMTGFRIDGAPEGTSMAMSAFPDISIPAPRIFSVFCEAIRTKERVLIDYLSMTSPRHEREISPHHIIRAGRRWHVRGFCHEQNGFRDFTLGRIAGATLKSKAEAEAKLKSEFVTDKEDAAWHAKVPVRLVAHPGLSRAQEEVIRFEFFSGTSARVVTCRGALVQYFIQDMRAATDVERQTPPDYQIAVSNVADLGQWLFRRGA